MEAGQMKTHKRKISLLFIVCSVLLLSSFRYSFADAGGTIPGARLAGVAHIDPGKAPARPSAIAPFAITTCKISFKKTKKTAAKASVHAKSNKTLKQIKCQVNLQVYAGGAYSNISGQSSTSTKKASSISHQCAFRISAGKKYRIRVVIKETTKEGSSTSRAYYKALE
jgi:hypothetical protein